MFYGFVKKSFGTHFLGLTVYGLLLPLALLMLIASAQPLNKTERFNAPIGALVMDAGAPDVDVNDAPLDQWLPLSAEIALEHGFRPPIVYTQVVPLNTVSAGFSARASPLTSHV